MARDEVDEQADAPTRREIDAALAEPVEDREEVGNRLVFDPEISESSPIVKGTWITVSHVVSLVVDGWTWADIIRVHPELTEDDIRACLAHQIETEGV